MSEKRRPFSERQRPDICYYRRRICSMSRDFAFRIFVLAQERNGNDYYGSYVSVRVCLCTYDGAPRK